MTRKKYRIIDYSTMDGVACPCGTARRGLTDEPGFPGTIHRTDIDRAAKPHYHKRITEIYYIISCEAGAAMVLDGERIPLHEEMALFIPPETIHHLDGKAKVFIVAWPKFDPADEYVCE